jgi:hypothetical protein
MFACQNHNACENYNLHVEITLKRVVITLMSVIFTRIRVKISLVWVEITLCLWNQPLRVEIVLHSEKKSCKVHQKNKWVENPCEFRWILTKFCENSYKFCQFSQNYDKIHQNSYGFSTHKFFWWILHDYFSECLRVDIKPVRIEITLHVQITLCLHVQSHSSV